MQNKTPGRDAASADNAGAKKAPARSKAQAAAVLIGGQEWAPAEVDSIREALGDEVVRLRAELHHAQEHLDQLRNTQQDGGGEDPVDTGAQATEREGELAIVSHATSTILQCEDALTRLDTGTFGTCERCGEPIARLRLQAFPKATTCIECKKLQERR